MPTWTQCSLPTAPVVPYVECVQDRITLEIMRGCPGKCRFCQSTTLKRPLRYRKVETILAAALECYRTTGYNEVSLLSLSTSDFPQLDELLARLQETFRPLGVSISLPSLRINEQLRTLGEMLTTDRTSGLTLAPEAARDDMRAQLGKPIRNDDLYAGCRRAMEHGFQRVKLYFMCGLPGERTVDLDGIIEMAETVAQLGREVQGRPATVVANVSNFVPKPHTPYQWHGMQTREYFQQAHHHIRRGVRLRSVQVKCHDVQTSLLEGVLSRGDRRLGPVIETVWRAAHAWTPGASTSGPSCGGRPWPRPGSTWRPWSIATARSTRAPLGPHRPAPGTPLPGAGACPGAAAAGDVVWRVTDVGRRSSEERCKGREKGKERKREKEKKGKAERTEEFR